MNYGKPNKDLRNLAHQPGFLTDIAEGRSNKIKSFST